MTLPPRRVVLNCLLAGHVPTGIVTAMTASGWWPQPTLAGSLAITFSSGGLLGLWAGLATVSPPVRAAGVLAGLLYLGSLFAMALHPPGLREMWTLLLLAALSICPAFLGSMVLGRFSPRLRLTLVDVERPDDALVQITVRFLFGLTAAFAALLTIFRVFGQLGDVIAARSSPEKPWLLLLPFSF